MASRRLDLPQPLGPTTPVRPGSIRSSAGSTKLLKPLSLSLRILNLSPSRERLPADGLLQRWLQLVPGRRILDHGAVDDECRRTDEARELRRCVARHLDELVDRALVGQALRALGDRDSANCG